MTETAEQTVQTQIELILQDPRCLSFQLYSLDAILPNETTLLLLVKQLWSCRDGLLYLTTPLMGRLRRRKRLTNTKCTTPKCLQ